MRMKRLLNWYYGSASIRKKLVISYLLLITVPILVLGVYSFSVSKRNMERQTEETIRNNVRLMASDLETSLKRENDNIKYLSYNAKFRQVLKNSRGNQVEVAQVLNEVVEPIFWYFITSDNNMKGIEIYTPYVSQEVGSFLKPVGDSSEESWYQYHQKNFGTLWTFENGSMFATRTVLDAQTASEPIGVLKLTVHPASVLEPISNNTFLNNGILLTDTEGKTIYSRQTGAEPADQAVLAGAEAGNLADGDQGEYIVMSEAISTSGWRLYYYVTKSEITGQLYEILKSTLLIVGLCLAVSLFLIGILSRVLSRRILELKESAEKVAEGNFNLELNHNDTDEIGIVSKSLQTMCDRLNEMINRVYKAELEKKAMELKALQAMINPHFLYNCLSSIKWKAIRTGNDEISDLTGLLAKFYRTSLNGGKQITTVGSELENVKSYVELQRMTHENSFDVEYELDETLFETSMPNFLLQPIVENAIEHGMNYQEEIEGRGRLIVRLEEEDGHLIFSILNNGPRVELDRLEEILNTPGRGYGIYNIEERIRIYYGAGCGVYASVTADGYTCFTVRIGKELKELSV
ncbi:HAMP domain protein [Hungatella hathewayi DSM 13479]|uniref:HAMP domain protein n=2 Tax=Hungatella hathewayi TaxID=154046 RepID=D3AQQ4_9FIRM|nr:HAMP domain protein [Hungatella hathewayi DSM 13479]